MASPPVRFPSGLNTLAARPTTSGSSTDTAPRKHPLYSYPAPDPFRLFADCNDMMDLGKSGTWTTTAVGTGTAAQLAFNGGAVQLITSATINDSVAWQRSVENIAVPAAPNRMWYEIVATAQIALSCQLVLGITALDTTPGAVTDGIYFTKAAGAATVNLVTTAGSASTTQATAIATLADATQFSLAFTLNRSGELEYYVNGALAGRISAPATMPVAATLLSLQNYIKTSAAATRYLNIHNLMVAAEYTPTVN